MFIETVAALTVLAQQSQGIPYVLGGDSPGGTDCSGIVSWLANRATDRPIYGDRFSTHNERQELLARGFQDGTAPNALVIGFNYHHTAATLPDGTNVQSDVGVGVQIGAVGAYDPQFTEHMFLPVDPLPWWMPPPPPQGA